MCTLHQQLSHSGVQDNAKEKTTAEYWLNLCAVDLPVDLPVDLLGRLYEAAQEIQLLLSRGFARVYGGGTGVPGNFRAQVNEFR